MRTQWPSPAKLNLFLYITGQRADGYHTLQTLFQFLDYGDTISIELRDDGDIRLLTPVEGVKESLDEMMKALKEAAPIQIENKYESIEIKVKH